MELVFAVLIIVAFLSLSNGLPTVLQLERAGPMRTNLTYHKLRDQIRWQKRTGVVSFPLEGSPDINKYGNYFTKVKIGSPPREYRLIIDTGSDVSWVSCTGCKTCPTSNSLGMKLQHYNPHSSSSASILSCSDKGCPNDHLPCDSQHERCKYRFEYMDNSVTMGFYVSDVFHFGTINGSTSTNFSKSLTFGCSQKRSGLINFDHAVDGILGLDPWRWSLNSQLSTPAFSHCLTGGETGGGVLVLGEILDPKMVYTPLDLSQGFYNVNLQSISLNGKVVQIDPTLFETKNGGTIVDSGTNPIVLGIHIYNPVISSLTSVASAFAQPVNIDGMQCFKVPYRMHYKFPVVSFNFQGGVSLTIKPKDYLWQWSDMDIPGVWCLGFEKPDIANVTTTTLGEIILQNRIVVYDLAGKRLGLVDRDCSKPFNISDIRIGSSMIDSHSISTLTSILTLIVYLIIFL